MILEPSAPPFLRQILDDGIVDTREAQILAAAHVDSLPTLWAVLRSFPSLGLVSGFNLPSLSSRLAQRFPVESQALAAASSRGEDLRPMIRFGAEAPEPSSIARGFKVPIPTEFAPLPAGHLAGQVLEPIDHRCPGGWLVRDQGQRGTCVAFASTACAEKQAGCDLDLSEQYLYWAIKDRIGDFWPHQDGTLLEFARRALAQEGLCEEHLWPYTATFDPTNIAQGGHGSPTMSAQANASKRTISAHRFHQGTPGGNAALLLSWLRTRPQPVAISVPVFSDPTVPTSDNWTSVLGWDFGRVLDPPPTAIASSGHAVCVTGFVPDHREFLGGWFVFRNSWSDQWGSRLPDPAYAGPEAGYGQLSASYVDQYLWEMLQL